MTRLEAKTALAAKLDINLTTIADNALFTAANLEYWIQAAIQKAWDFQPWPFTKKTVTFTTVDDTYYDHPTTLMPHSLSRLTIGGERFNPPMPFDDYEAWQEDNPTSTDKNWAMHENFVFINRLAYTPGAEGIFTGKKFPPSLSQDTDLLPFSPMTDNQEHSGNHAIVELAYAEALASDKLKRTSDAKAVRDEAKETLVLLWKPFAEQMAFPQTTKPMFNTPDYFASGRGDSRRRIGNF